MDSNVIAIKILASFFFPGELKKLILKFIGQLKGPKTSWKKMDTLGRFSLFAIKIYYKASNYDMLNIL